MVTTLKGRIVMKNRYTVSIAGSDYTVMASESEEYVKRVAEYVDQKMQEVLKAGNISVMMASVLTSVNICDECFKAKQNSENMRSQLKAYVADASRAKVELNEAHREIERLKTELARLRTTR
jgi:cell division protein ZapA